jgi:hypothetical protein
MYRWNRTLNRWFPPRNCSVDRGCYLNGDPYSSANPRYYPTNSTCLYPCAEFWWPTRGVEDIYIQAQRPSEPSERTPDAFGLLVFIAIGWYLLSLILNIGLFFLSTRTNRGRGGTLPGIGASWADFKAVSPSGPGSRRTRRRLTALAMIAIDIFAWAALFVGLILLGASEWILWNNNPTLLAEDFIHVGQWSVLASTALLFGGVLFTTGYQPRREE